MSAKASVLRTGRDKNEHGSLPGHGRVECAICHGVQPYDFDRTRTEVDGWRITNCTSPEHLRQVGPGFSGELASSGVDI